MRYSEKMNLKIAAQEAEWQRRRHRRRIYNYESLVLDNDEGLSVWLTKSQAEKEATELARRVWSGWGDRKIRVVIDPKLTVPIADVKLKRIRFPGLAWVTLRRVCHEAAHVVAYLSLGHEGHGRAWWLIYEQMLKIELGPQADALLARRGEFGVA